MENFLGGSNRIKREEYSKDSITNDEDYEIRSELDRSDRLIKTDPEAALEGFNRILQGGLKSPRALYGRARALDILSEKKRSNKLLEASVKTFTDLLGLGDKVPDDLMTLAGNRCVERMNFRGWNAKALDVLDLMAKRFSENSDIKNQIGTQYLLMGEDRKARKPFQEVLRTDPLNAYAARHLGFILKIEGKYERGVELLLKGIKLSKEDVDGKFYYHLGEGLRRLGKEKEANEIYKEGVAKGKFLSFWQRSLYNVEGLKGQPVWTKEETGQAGGLLLLEHNWREIRKEAEAMISSFDAEKEGLLDTGDWGQLDLYVRGRRQASCDRAPKTCAIIDSIPAATTNVRGQVKFSRMLPGTHVKPHSGPTNCRLRAHLGLKVPANNGDLKLRVADKLLFWEEGRVIVFDDSFDHEVWHEADSERIVLIVDLWHPDLDEATRASLHPI